MLCRLQEKHMKNVWQDGLYYKLLTSGIKPGMVRIIHSMYRNTQQGFKINGSVTKPFNSYGGGGGGWRGCKTRMCVKPITFQLIH